MQNEQNKASFDSFGLRQEILLAIEEMGFTEPSKVQEFAIPPILDGKDLIAQAATGSGKTAAFALPALERLSEEDSEEDSIGLLVLSPTRELACQISKEVCRFSKNLNFKTLAVFGGTSIPEQIKAIKKGVNAIVATPGRLLDLLRSKKIKNFKPKIVVLDEADEMLDMGFLQEIHEIFSFLPEKRQSLLFSATMPKAIVKLAQEILKDPLQINLSENKKAHNDIKESYYLSQERDKNQALIRLLDYLQPCKSIIFCRTKRDVEIVHNSLLAKKLPVRYLHGDIPQKERENCTEAFRSGQCKILVASDLAARGLNIPDISHVFNYHAPQTKESYTHRIGRTGRAGKKGSAISILSPSEFQRTMRLLGRKKEQFDIKELPSLEDLKEKHRDGLIQDIVQQKAHQDSEGIFEELEKTLKPRQIGIHLLSLLLEDKNFQGPETFSLHDKKKSSLKTKDHYRNRKDRQKDRKRFFKKPKKGSGKR